MVWPSWFDTLSSRKREHLSCLPSKCENRDQAQAENASCAFLWYHGKDQNKMTRVWAALRLFLLETALLTQCWKFPKLSDFEAYERQSFFQSFLSVSLCPSRIFPSAHLFLHKKILWESQLWGPWYKIENSRRNVRISSRNLKDTSALYCNLLLSTWVLYKQRRGFKSK